MLGWKAALSPIESAGARDLVLITFALAGYLIGRAQDANHSRALLLGLLVVVSGNSTVAIIQCSVPDWNPIYPGRAADFPSGFFSHYNHAANFGLGSAGLFLSAMIRSQRASKALSGFGLVASLLMVLLSLSRGGNLALVCVLVAAVFLFSAKLRRRGSNVWLLWAAVVTAGLLIGPLVMLAVSRVAGLRSNVVQEGGFADGGRLSFYDAAWKLFLQRPLTGGGAGSFGSDVYQVLPSDFKLAAEPEMVHNEILQLLVDYGAPCAIVLIFLIFVPIVRQCTRYQLGRSSGGGVWESIGLAGMLIQSNFDFVFHVAPCTFLLALILGRISRPRRLRAAGDEWELVHGISRLRAEEYYQEARAAEARAEGRDAFIAAVKGYASAFLAGRKRSEFRLIVLLLSSQDEIWHRHANELVLREKMSDRKGMAEVMRRIVEDCLERGAVRWEPEKSREWPGSPNRPGWGRALRRLGVAIIAIALMAAGARLTEFSVALWNPIYHPEGMSPARRFEALVLVQEKAPFLGIERKVLAAFIERLYAFSSLEAREFWATSSYKRLLSTSAAADHDPVVALQLATVAGWACEQKEALFLYDQAIYRQSVHERIFMAHFFKGEYFQDLMVSSAAEEDMERSRSYAMLATHEFQRSLELAPFGGVHHQRRQELLLSCEEVLAVGSPR